MIKIQILSSTPANDIVCLFWAHVHDSRMDSDWLSMSVSFISWNKNRSESYSNDIVSLCLYRYSRGVDSLILRTICRTVSLSSLVWRGLLIGQFIIGVWLCCLVFCVNRSSRWSGSSLWSRSIHTAESSTWSKWEHLRPCELHYAVFIHRASKSSLVCFTIGQVSV